MKNLLIICLTICVLITGKAHASVVNEDKYFCQPFFQNIDKVYVTYRHELPFSETLEWDKIINRIKEEYESYYLSNGIKIEFRENSENAYSDNNSLNLNLVFSYVHEDSFSIKPKASLLAVWIDLSKVNKEGIIETRQTDIALNYFPENLSNPWLRVSSSHWDLLDDVTCSILEFSAEQKCSQKADTLIFEPIPENLKCVIEPEDENLKKYIEDNFYKEE